ncbi:MAG: M3 family oligoendopeptidase [Proteobacteria bacterium]|nr:M3 family oligoendopeptidase [Pseudomonadota bacterium]NCA28187.1 M3 family oligoendopeptidase [Pseudomonadota bacterium]
MPKNNLAKKNSQKSPKNSQKNQLPTWDLSDLYQSIDDKKITNDLKIIEKDCANFYDNFHNKIANISAKKLFMAILQYQEICEKIGKISSYIYLVYSSDLSNQKILNFYQNISEKLSVFENKLIFFTLEINDIDEIKYKKLITDKDLKTFYPFLRDIRFFKKHQLSKELESFALDKNITSRNAFVRLFDETINNLKFSYRGKILNSQNIFDLMSNGDDLIRKDAGLAIAKTFKDNAKIFAFITNILAKDKSIDDNYRGFAKPISSRNLNNFIEDEVVDLLVKKVQENYVDISHRYYKIKAKILGKKFLNFYDRNAPLNSKDNSKISWQEAKNLVLEAYQDFNPKMRVIAEQFFDKNWIDAQVRDGKDSGAYSHSCVPSVHPFILMNFQGKVRDVMTLAHELGHGIHQFLARKQGYLMAQTPLTLAETASVFGEQLTFQKILANEKNIHHKKFIIANKIEDMINTVIRQIAFLNFEQKVHFERKNGEIPLEKICDFWLEVQKLSLGEQKSSGAFKFHDDYKYFWCYIPHFIHSPFYVYSYAFGDCLVNSLYGVYQSKKIKNFDDKYISMLELGGSQHHKEMLAPFGLAIDSPEFWESGLTVIKNYIDQLEEML